MGWVVIKERNAFRYLPRGTLDHHRIQMNIEAVLRGECLVTMESSSVSMVRLNSKEMSVKDWLEGYLPVNDSAPSLTAQSHISVFVQEMNDGSMLSTELLIANATLPDTKGLFDEGQLLVVEVLRFVFFRRPSGCMSGLRYCGCNWRRRVGIHRATGDIGGKDSLDMDGRGVVISIRGVDQPRERRII